MTNKMTDDEKTTQELHAFVQEVQELLNQHPRTFVQEVQELLNKYPRIKSYGDRRTCIHP